MNAHLNQLRLPLLLLLPVVFGEARAEFILLGDLPGGLIGSTALGVSADGTTVVGASAETFGPIVDEAFRWTQATGMVALGTLPGYSNSRANAVSGDGAVVVGWSNTPSGSFESFRWTESTGMVSLGWGGTLPWGISADGHVIVGQILDAGAFRWTEASGFVDIGGRSAFGASSDGAVVVGVDNSGMAFRWTASSGLVGLGVLPGRTESVAMDVSADGSVVAGFSGNEAFRWTEATGVIGLGELPGRDFFSFARAISANGSVIVGESSTDSPYSFEAFVWDADNGMRNLREVLIAQGDDLTGWYLVSAMDVSADGRTIVGWGINPDGQTEGWLARLTSVGRQNVRIDIKPGSSTNTINPRSKGKIPVAILTTDHFDATTVDPTSVLFGRTGEEARAVHFALKDVDHDGNTDIVLHFETRRTGIACADATATLTGRTIDGQLIEGSDSIRTVGCKYR